MKNNTKHIREKYRRLLNMFEGYNNNNITCIAVTSNNAREGKTIVAKNVAVTLAKSGKKTLFIDCNVSSYSKVKAFNNSEIDGLVTILKDIKRTSNNDLQLKRYIYGTDCEHLSIMALGTNDLDKYSSVFKIGYLRKVTLQLKKDFENIIIDSPSFENLSYTQIITSSSDGCLFVLKDGVNEVSEASIIKEKLETIGCKVLGCILEKEKTPTKIFNDKHNDFFRVGYKNEKSVLTNSNVSLDI